MARGSNGGGLGTMVTIFGAIVGLATIAVIVSQRAQTSKVIEALSKGVGNVIGAAVSPVVGGGQ